MTTYGPTDTGFRRKRADEIMADIKAYIRSPEGIGPNAPVDDSPFEELLGCFVAQLDEGWQALEDTYNAFDPDAASGTALDNLMALTGLTRLPATPSTGVVTITANSLTSVDIPKGFEVKNSATDARFVTVEAATIPAAGSMDFAIECTVVGPVSSDAGDIDTAVTVIAGVESVTNNDAVTPGRLLETDPQARVRREKSLQVLGKGTVAGMQADLLQLPFVQAARVLENDTGNTVNGMKPYSVRPVLWPVITNAEDKKTVAALLWTHKSGILFDASDVTVTVTSNGIQHQVSWDWADDVPVFITATITPMGGYTVAGLKADVKAVITNYMKQLIVGEDVRVLPIYAAIDGVEGVDSVVLKLGKTSNPTGTTDIAIADTEIALIDNINDVVVN